MWSGDLSLRQASAVSDGDDHVAGVAAADLWTGLSQLHAVIGREVDGHRKAVGLDGWQVGHIQPH
jgi:hypothetical protein